MMSKGTFRNELLQKLDSEVITRLRLRYIDLPVNFAVEFPGGNIDHLLFIEEGIASMTTEFQDGSHVGVALVGREAVLGASSMIGTSRSLNRVYMQMAGHGFVSRTSVARHEFQRCETFHDLTLRYLQAQFIQTAQSAACNARHPIEQRLARWLLLCADRTDDTIIPISQQFIADMLGVTRSSVTIAAISFQERKLIQYTRGKLQLIDRPRLESVACECYRVVKDHLSNQPA